MSLLPMSELEEMILAGWGDMRRDQIPKNWRNLKPPMLVSDFFTEKPQPVEKRKIDPDAASCLANEYLRAEQIRKSQGRPKGRKDSKPRAQKASFEMRLAAMRARIAAGRLPRTKPAILQSDRRAEYLKETGRQETA